MNRKWEGAISPTFDIDHLVRLHGALLPLDHGRRSAWSFRVFTRHVNAFGAASRMLTGSRVATLLPCSGSAFYENRCRVVHFSPVLPYLLAPGNFRGHRLGGTDGLPPGKWTSSFGVANFERVLWHYFMRFHGSDGMHAGYLPGYAASHGCVRMPEQYAIAFFNSVNVGTPVTVFGRTPTGRYLGQSQSPFMRGGNRFADPRFGRQFDPRFGPPPPP